MELHRVKERWLSGWRQIVHRGRLTNIERINDDDWSNKRLIRAFMMVVGKKAMVFTTLHNEAMTILFFRIQSPNRCHHRRSLNLYRDQLLGRPFDPAPRNKDEKKESWWNPCMDLSCGWSKSTHGRDIKVFDVNIWIKFWLNGGFELFLNQCIPIQSCKPFVSLNMINNQIKGLIRMTWFDFSVLWLTKLP